MNELDQNPTEILPSIKKKLRNQEIYIQIATGTTKDDICKQCKLSLRQLNRILAEANAEAEQWYKSLPRQTMIQIFRFNSEKIFNEIRVLEKIRNSVSDPVKKFEMTKTIINTYMQYNKMVAEGPSLIRQKEVTDEAEKIIEKK